MMAVERKKRVLIISFLFPPIGGAGSVRIAKFAKYLSEFGWEPVILTVDRISHQPKILDMKESGCEVFRTPYFDLQELIVRKLANKKKTYIQTRVVEVKPKKSIEDRLLNTIRLLRPIYRLPLIRTLLLDPLGWYYYAVKKGLEIVANERVDLIFSTYSPSTCHLVASRMQQATKIPWVAEFRDLWALNVNIRKTQPFHFLEKQLEKRVMQRCSQLVTVSEPLANRLRELHSKETTVVYNGYDETDAAIDVPLKTKFTMTYTGSVYGKRDPSSLFKAVNLLKQEGIITESTFEIRFFGDDSPFLAHLITEYNLHALVKVHNRISYKDCIRKQKESTALLFIGWNDSMETGNLSTKIFEYIGAGRPILSLSYEGEIVSELVKKSGCGVVANQSGKIKDILIDWLEQFKKHGDIVSGYACSTATRNTYTRREQTKKLAELFNRVIGTPQGNRKGQGERTIA
jgi:glycosyltransferase involved in cell wall biosynthesis